jgi:hypothetical protein
LVEPQRWNLFCAARVRFMKKRVKCVHITTSLSGADTQFSCDAFSHMYLAWHLPGMRTACVLLDRKAREAIPKARRVRAGKRRRGLKL